LHDVIECADDAMGIIARRESDKEKILESGELADLGEAVLALADGWLNISPRKLATDHALKLKRDEYLKFVLSDPEYIAGLYANLIGRKRVLESGRKSDLEHYDLEQDIGLCYQIFSYMEEHSLFNNSNMPFVFDTIRGVMKMEDRKSYRLGGWRYARFVDRASFLRENKNWLLGIAIRNVGMLPGERDDQYQELHKVIGWYIGEQDVVALEDEFTRGTKSLLTWFAPEVAEIYLRPRFSNDESEEVAASEEEVLEYIGGHPEIASKVQIRLLAILSNIQREATQFSGTQDIFRRLRDSIVEDELLKSIAKIDAGINSSLDEELKRIFNIYPEV